jgi:DNA-binding ferritin-like protein
MQHSKVNGHSNLIRDEETKAIINTSMSDYNAYMSQKRSKEKENQKIQTIENNVANLKSDLDEIKNLLRRIIDEPR